MHPGLGDARVDLAPGRVLRAGRPELGQTGLGLGQPELGVRRAVEYGVLPEPQRERRGLFDAVDQGAHLGLAVQHDGGALVLEAQDLGGLHQAGPLGPLHFVQHRLRKVARVVVEVVDDLVLVRDVGPRHGAHRGAQAVPGGLELAEAGRAIEAQLLERAFLDAELAGRILFGHPGLPHPLELLHIRGCQALGRHLEGRLEREVAGDLQQPRAGELIGRQVFGDDFARGFGVRDVIRPVRAESLEAFIPRQKDFVHGGGRLDAKMLIRAWPEPTAGIKDDRLAPPHQLGVEDDIFAVFWVALHALGVFLLKLFFNEPAGGPPKYFAPGRRPAAQTGSWAA